jgi:hypothetical protein
MDEKRCGSINIYAMDVINKYQYWYDKIISRARNRQLLGYYETHHIIPKSLGGDITQHNLVNLTAREHYICHLLLTKITRGDDRVKMISAYWFISGRTERKNSKLYAVLKEQRKELVGAKIRASMVGKKYSKERCYNIKLAKKGQIYKPRSEDHLRNLSLSKKGKTWEEIYGVEGAELKRKNMRKVLKGRKQTPEHISAVLAGKAKKKLSILSHNMTYYKPEERKENGG